jgi:hypothetical protein
MGQRVRHPIFGEGKILDKSGTGRKRQSHRPLRLRRSKTNFSPLRQFRTSVKTGTESTNQLTGGECAMIKMEFSESEFKKLIETVYWPIG